MRVLLYLLYVSAVSFSAIGQDYDFGRIFFNNKHRIQEKIAALKIASFVIYDLEYDSAGNSDKLKLRECRFDSNGNLLEDLYYNTQDPNSKTTPVFMTKDVYRYTSSGLPIEQIHYQEGNTDAEWTKNLEVNTVALEANDSPHAITSTLLYYRYDGNKCTEADSTNQGVITQYHYEKNNLVAAYRSDKNADTNDTTLYLYDNRGNCVRYKTTIITCEQDVILLEREYDKKNRLLRQTFLTAGGETETTTLNYKDNIHIKTEYFDVEHRLQLFIDAEYSANGLKKKEIRYDPEGKPVDGEVYEYVYR